MTINQLPDPAMPDPGRERGAERHVKTTCARDCYDACGMVVTSRDGVGLSVRGDPDHPLNRGKLCGKCSIAYNGAWLDPQRRLTQPLLRVGRKGEGRFQPITWDDALTRIAGNFQRITARRGHGATILHTHFQGTRGEIGRTFPMRFFHRLGATEVIPGTICDQAGHDALVAMYGDSGIGFDPRQIAHARCVMVVGANPSHSAPHVHKQWLGEFKGDLIVIDPLRTETAAMATIHLQPYPGTDAMLAFALLRLMRDEERIDRRYLADHTLGWESVDRQLDGLSVTQAVAVTGVPEALMRQAALAYAKGPSLLWLGIGLQRQRTGGNIMRSFGLLPAATGNLGRPGAGFLYYNDPHARGVSSAYMESPHLARGPMRKISHFDLAGDLADATKSDALVVWNSNPVASSANQRLLKDALCREDLLTVVIDLFETDTVRYADIVLPAASALEFDDLIYPYFEHRISAQVRAMDPPGEALPNAEIFRGLASAMGYTEPELHESDASMLAELLKDAGVSFQTLAAQGTMLFGEAPFVQFADGRFPTPSTRIEIESTPADASVPNAAPTPIVEPREPGRLRLLSPSSAWLMNSSYGNDPKIQRQLGEDAAHFHPDDLASLGVSDGDEVSLWNDSGELTLRARAAPWVVGGAVVVYKSRWLAGDAHAANVNVLHEPHTADFGRSTAVNSSMVSVRLARPLPAARLGQTIA